MTLLITLSVIEIALLIAGLAVYLFIVGGQLNRIATNLEESYATAGEIVGHAALIDPGLDHINRTGGVVAGALPLLYGMAEGIVRGATWTPKTDDRAPAMPASGRRRSRIMESVGIRLP
jgi:hypothetical protein